MAADPTLQAIARDIYQRCHLNGEFTLRSGQVSNEYFDKYLFETDPELLHRICQGLVKKIPPETDLLAGLEMGGIPIVTQLSYLSGIPALFVRKTAKGYGTEKLAEGPAFAGRRLTIVEDVVSTGGQIILSTQDLRAAGAEVSNALCVIDRESGGKGKLAAEGLALHSLLTMSDLKAAS